MPSFILDKAVLFSSPVTKLNSLTLDDHLNYVLLYEGIRVQGTIALVGECSHERRCQPFSEVIEVDIFLPNNAICDLKNLQIRVTDYSYDMGEDTIIFHVTCNIEGEELDEEKFMFEKEVEKNFKFIHENPVELTFEDHRNSFSEEELADLERLIGKKDVEVISTIEDIDKFTRGEEVAESASENIEIEVLNEKTEAVDPAHEEKAEEILDGLAENAASYVRTEKEEVVEILDDSEEMMVICEEIGLPEVMEEIPEEQIATMPIEAMKKDFLESIDEDVFMLDLGRNKKPAIPVARKEARLDIKEKFVVSFSFYRVSKDDDYLKIARKYGIDAKKLIDHNRNKELSVGLLIEIPNERPS